MNNGNKMKVMNHCVEPFFLFLRMCVEPSRFMCHICFMPACKWPERNVRQPDHLTGSNNFSGVHLLRSFTRPEHPAGNLRGCGILDSASYLSFILVDSCTDHHVSVSCQP